MSFNLSFSNSTLVAFQDVPSMQFNISFSADSYWWDSDWNRSKYIVVENPLAEYQYNLTVWKEDGHDDSSTGNIDCEGKCNDNFSDIRFVYDNTTELSYWMENYTSGVCGRFWINSSLQNYSSFYMYYENPDYGPSGDFVNGQFYHETVYVNEGPYTFPADMKVRFMCDASGNADDIYIDEIKVSAK